MTKELTEHAIVRVRKRAGIPKKAVQKYADNALEKGVTHKESTGRLKRYFDYLYLSHGTGANIRMYGNYVYIFTQQHLITVFPVPNVHKNAVIKLQKRKEALQKAGNE